MIGKRVRLKNSPDTPRALPEHLLGQTGVVEQAANGRSTWFAWRVLLDEPGPWRQKKAWANESELEVIE